MWEDFQKQFARKYTIKDTINMYEEKHLVILNLRSYKKTHDRMKCTNENFHPDFIRYSFNKLFSMNCLYIFWLFFY